MSKIKIVSLAVPRELKQFYSMLHLLYFWEATSLAYTIEKKIMAVRGSDLEPDA